MKKHLQYLIVMIPLLSFFLLQSCASLGTAGSPYQWIDYNYDYERVKSVAEQAIKGTNLRISHVNEAEDKKQIRIIFSKNASLNNQSIQEHQGLIVIQKLAEGKSRVRVENPDYHYSVPDYEREDYQRILLSRIDDILG